MWFNIDTNVMIEWESEAGSVYFVRFFSLLTFSICFPTTGLLKLVVTRQKLFVVNRFVAGLITCQACFSSVSTTCDRPVENSIAAALSQQLVTDLLTGRCGPVRTDRYKASEHIQISACWQQVLTDLLHFCSDLREIGCIYWMSLTNTIKLVSRIEI
jgi:hypothetical protein